MKPVQANFGQYIFNGLKAAEKAKELERFVKILTFGMRYGEEVLG